LKKVAEKFGYFKIFCNFAIEIEISIATIGGGFEKPEQVQFSLALHDSCSIIIKRDADHPV